MKYLWTHEHICICYGSFITLELFQIFWLYSQQSSNISKNSKNNKYSNNNTNLTSLQPVVAAAIQKFLTIVLSFLLFFFLEIGACLLKPNSAALKWFQFQWLFLPLFDILSVMTKIVTHSLKSTVLCMCLFHCFVSKSPTIICLPSLDDQLNQKQSIVLLLAKT